MGILAGRFSMTSSSRRSLLLALGLPGSTAHCMGMFRSASEPENSGGTMTLVPPGTWRERERDRERERVPSVALRLEAGWTPSTRRSAWRLLV